MNASKLSVIERIEKLTERVTESGCWIWMGQLRGGYGRIKLGGRKGKAFSVHRLTYEHFRGPMPEGLEPDHLCRVRCCVNPWHLEAVTHRENGHRGNIGKHLSSRTHCPQGHPYDEVNTLAYQKRSGGRPGVLYRMCRECSRTRTRAWRLQRKQTK